MKKLGKLKLNELSLEEQKLLKGGATWDPATQSYSLPEVTVTPEPTSAYVGYVKEVINYIVDCYFSL